MTDTRVWKVPEAAPSPVEFAQAWSRVVTSAADLMKSSAEAAAIRPAPLPYDPSAPIKAFSGFAAHLLTDPAYAMKVQGQAVSDWMQLMSAAATRAAGGTPAPVIEPERGDRRFKDPAWSEEPVFDYLKQAYLLASKRMVEAVEGAEGIDEATRTQALFYTNQLLHALSPANFPHTNPEAIRRAIETGSVSLISGLANALADAAASPGIVQRRAAETFELGVDIAATTGEVVYQNELMQLIQYAPTTQGVYRRPVLYVPPLVNKYYLLDLTPKSSLMRWLVEQGHSVFVISWVNPGPELADTDIADYLKLGPIAAMDAIERETDESQVDLFGFCMGGTLIAMLLAYLAGKGETERVASATTIGSLFDFAELGQWATFTDPAQLQAMERHLDHKGFMAAQDFQALFSAVRANDLIWSSVVSHYLLDREAPPSDILYWFADGAHIPRAFLLTYATELLRDNKLKEPGAMVLDGVALDLSKVTTPVMAISLKDDHVSAWGATYRGARLFGGPVSFLLGGSGHNAGVINPPSANKHGFWVNDAMPESADEWLAGAEKKDGSWWPHWQAWLAKGQDKVPPRVPGAGGLGVIEPAPGSYVRMKG
jgi:polyhydroxyalkanoate synthase subunit PhaC